MERLHPPIQPYTSPPSNDSTPPSNPLTFEEAAQLEFYLPAPRFDYLPETFDADSRSHRLVDYEDATLPHVTLTYAQSMDAQISLQPGIQTILSGPQSKAMTHYLRSRHDAIMVGAGTAKADNPGLSTRYSEDGRTVVGLHRQPRPIILDPRGTSKVEDTPKLFALANKGEGRAPWWIAGLGGLHLDAELVEKIKGVNGGIVDAGVYKSKEDGVDWEVILKGIAVTGVRSVMIEGGGAVIKDLLRKRNQKYISSVIVTVAPTYLGAGGIDIAPRRSLDTENEVNLKTVKWIPLGQDVVMAGVLK